MSKSGEELNQEELKKKAYLIALRLKNTGSDHETIYARLEKQGIPENIAKEVVRDIMIERKRNIVKEATPVHNFGLVQIGIGLGVALITYLLTDNVLLPIGVILGGVVTVLLMKKKMDQ